MNKTVKFLGIITLAIAIYKIMKSKKETPHPISKDMGTDSLRVNRNMVSRNIDVFERLRDR